MPDALPALPPGIPPLAGAPMPPGMGAPPPAPPPGLGVPKPQGNPGNAAGALMKVRDALKLLESALPEIPMGSEFHTKALKVIGMIHEALPDQDAGASGPQLTGLLQLIRQQSQNAPNAALAHLTPGAPPNAPPMMAGAPGPQ